MQLHQPILACVVGKTCQHYFCKRQEHRLRGHYSRSSHWYILFLQWLCTYSYIRSHLASFLRSILCATAVCITMCHSDIDVYTRVAFSRVFLKSAGYLVSQIKNLHQQTIFIASIFSYQLPTNWQAMAKREEVNGDSIANKRSIFHTKQWHTKQ